MPEDPDTFGAGLAQALAKHSAVGESASKGKAERTLQAAEDMVRTLKSALESRIKSRNGTATAIMIWLVEHVASILNRYSVNQDGQSPRQPVPSWIIAGALEPLLALHQLPTPIMLPCLTAI